MSKPLLKWAPAVPVRARDNLISSAAREKNQTGFIPSYEEEGKQHMNFLMSNEYMRIWYKERGKYEKDIYSREETIKEESKIKRRVVQRMMTYRRPLKNDFIDDYIQKKKGKEHGEEPVIGIEKMKFRPDCQRKKKTGSQAKSSPTTETKGAEEAKQTNQAKKSEKEAKGTNQTKKAEEAKAHKKAKEAKEMKETTEKPKKGTGDDEDDCGNATEVMLVCLDYANNNNSTCECNKNK